MLSRTVIAIVLGSSAVACSKSEPASHAPAAATAPAAQAPAAEPAAAPAAPAPAPVAQAPDPQTIFKARCVMCHGETGQGDGAAAAAMNPKPRNYHDADWQKSVTDDQIKQAITGGGTAIGKSPLMPGQPDLIGKTETLDGLVKLIRGFAKS